MIPTGICSQVFLCPLCLVLPFVSVPPAARVARLRGTSLACKVWAPASICDDAYPCAPCPVSSIVLVPIAARAVRPRDTPAVCSVPLLTRNPFPALSLVYGVGALFKQNKYNAIWVVFSFRVEDSFRNSAESLEGRKVGRELRTHLSGVFSRLSRVGSVVWFLVELTCFKRNQSL